MAAFATFSPANLVACALWSAVVACAATPAASTSSAYAAPSESDEKLIKKVAWSGMGGYRVLVKVDATDLGDRESDEGPALVEVDWPKLLESIGGSGKADLRTLQVMQIDADTGRPILHSDYAYQRSPYDRAFRWYDDAIPYEFPEVLAPSSYTDGDRRRRTNVRAGYMYNAVGDWTSGKLAWTHQQDGDEPSYYAVYFDGIDSDSSPPDAEPVGWIGDAMPRHDRWSGSTTGADTTRIALDDWNDDGLFDIVFGEQYGQLSYILNQGKTEEPKFGPTRMILESDGKPLDVGMHAAPLVIDWDGDGVKDLLVGTYKNRIAFFRNTGTNRERTLKYQGFIRDATGEFLSLPVTPVAQKSEGVFKEDYFPVLSAADWDDDGDVDLLCGGYITGRVYFYRNTGRQDGLPVLEFVGPVSADGEPINVRDWCAAPTAADLNGDGLLDLVVGSYTWHTSQVERPSFLRYYVNVGTAAEPHFREMPLPVHGTANPLRLPHPRVTDTNADGLADLVVASGSSILVFPNIGTRQDPLFDVERRPIRTAWGNSQVPADHQILDWNDDGWPDLVNGYIVHLNAKIGKPYFWTKSTPVLPAGLRIEHRVDLGDGHFYPYLHDMDRDGRTDVLFGDWHGHVWLHRNETTDQVKQFDADGQKLETTDDAPIKVGPLGGDVESDFQTLQGARTTLVAGDYNGDGLDDLIVGDTYGKVRYFENVGPADSPRFAPADEIADLKRRLHVEKADWNKDGRLDVVVSCSDHRIYVLLNDGSPTETRFEEPVPLDVEIKSPIAMVADLNRDGDEDLLVNGTQGTTFVERSYLERGYAPAQVLKVEKLAESQEN